METAVSGPSYRVAWQQCIECRKSLNAGESAINCTVCQFINKGIQLFIASKSELKHQEQITVSRIFVRDSQYESFKISTEQKAYHIGYFVTPDVQVPSLRKMCRGFVRIPARAILSPRFQSRPRGPGNLEDRLDLALEWLRSCRNSHVQCKVAYLEAPKRLLQLDAYWQDVRLREDVDANTYDPVTFNPTFRYACLSYCWGNAQALRTTTTNIKTMKERIVWETLPRTIQDAITVTRALDIPYLWVDSLCIIQDSAEDWTTQSRQMASIYGTATVTIAASKASNSSVGFLGSSGNEAIPIRNAAGTVWVREMHSHPYAGVDHNDLDNEDKDVLQPNPLDRRAWAFQEHLLSRRSLLFGHQEMFWLCRDFHDCECGEGRSAQLRYQLIRRGAPTWANLHNRLLSSMLVDGSPWSRPSFSVFAETWRSVVEHYTTRRLTMETDRLVALSGIISKAAETVRAVCHAGHWRAIEDRSKTGLNRLAADAMGDEEFAKGLCWYHNSGRRPTTYRAPTWSWASIESDVGVSHAYKFNDDHVDLDFSTSRVIDLGCPAVPLIDDQDTSRRILLLETLIYHVHITYEEGEFKVHADGSTLDGPLLLDCIEAEANMLQAVDLCLVTLAVYRPRSEDWAMPGEPNGQRIETAVGLVCKPSKLSPGHFERIGLWITQEAPDLERFSESEFGKPSGYSGQSARGQISLI